MGFKDFIKNPGKAFWDILESKDESNTDLENQHESKEGIEGRGLDDKKPSFFEKVKKADWSWLLKGKTGKFLKISIPLIILLLLLQPFFIRQNTPDVDRPPVTDPGDLLEKPPFEKLGYTSASLDLENKFLLYLPDEQQIHQVGVRGIVLNSYSISSNNIDTYLFPIDKDNYLYINRNSDLVLHYYEVIPAESRSDEDEIIEEDILLIENISPVDIKGIHKTKDENLAFTYDGSFYVYNLSGELVKSIGINEGDLYTYYQGNIYFIRENGDNTFSLIRLNESNEEIFGLNVGSYEPRKLLIINSSRYLLVYARPTEDSFYFVEMRDPDGRTLFNFTPKEEIEKIVDLDYVSFNTAENNILFVGDEISKLFNLNGNQLWIR